MSHKYPMEKYIQKRITAKNKIIQEQALKLFNQKEELSELKKECAALKIENESLKEFKESLSKKMNLSKEELEQMCKREKETSEMYSCISGLMKSFGVIAP